MAGGTSNARVKVRVQRNRFKRVAQRLPEYAERVVSETAKKIEDAARAKAPRAAEHKGDGPPLADSFGSRSARFERDSPRWIVWNSAPYSAFVEYGTQYAKAAKFLKPTARREIRGFRKQFAELEKALKEEE